MILITGATGQSGVEIVKALSAKNVELKALVRNPAKADAIRLANVELVTGDLADTASVAAACKGVDTLLLNSGPTPDIADLQSSVVAAAKSAGVKRIVKFSAAGADPNAKHRFGYLHGRAEEAVKQSGLAWTILRPTFFMENLLAMAGMIKGGTIYQPAGTGKAPFVALADVGAAFAGALAGDYNGQTFEVTGPQDLSYADVAAALTKAIGKPVQYVDVPPQAALDGMLQAGMPRWNAEGVNELTALLKAGYTAGPTEAVFNLAGRPPQAIEHWLSVHRTAFQ